MSDTNAHANAHAHAHAIAHEFNFDGLVGPTHNYSGLSFGNRASAKNQGVVANPKLAALQGLAKMKALHDRGWQQGVLAALLGTGLLGGLARLGWLDGVVNQIALDNLEDVPFTQLANLTGTPAMSVPRHWCENGLPLGVQFIGRLGDEATLLQLAAELEEAQPWAQRRPALALA